MYNINELIDDFREDENMSHKQIQNEITKSVRTTKDWLENLNLDSIILESKR